MKLFIAFSCRGILWKLCSSSFFLIFSWGGVAWNTLDIVEQNVFSRLCFSVGVKRCHRFQCNDWPPTRLHQIRKVPFGRLRLSGNYCCQPSAKLALLKSSEAGSWSRQKGSDCIQLRVVFCGWSAGLSQDSVIILYTAGVQRPAVWCAWNCFPQQLCSLSSSGCLGDHTHSQASDGDKPPRTSRPLSKQILRCPFEGCCRTFTWPAHFKYHLKTHR